MQTTNFDLGLLPKRERWRDRLLLLFWALLLLALAVREATISAGLLAYLLFIPGIIFFVPALYLLVVHTLQREFGRGALALILTLGPVMGLQVHPRAGARGECDFRVATCNAHSYTANVTKVGFSLNSVKADAIMFQEIWTSEHLRKMQRALPEFRFFPEFDRSKFVYFDQGNFIAVHKDYEVSQVVEFGQAVSLKAEKDGWEVTLINVHGDKRFQYYPTDVSATVQAQLSQSQSVRSKAALRGGTVIVAGDLNSPPSGPLPASLRSEFEDSFEASGNGWGWTFPASAPFWRLDQILSRGPISAQASRTLVTGSDHLAVVVEYQRRE